MSQQNGTESHPHAERWLQPAGGERPELVVYNTFTRTKVNLMNRWEFNSC